MVVSEAKRGNLLIVVTAAGGRGKTTTAKKLMWHWANGDFLDDYCLVVWIDVKQINCEVDLCTNVLLQYPFIKGCSQFESHQLKAIPEMFRLSQKRIIWMLDGLDESINHDSMRDFVKKSTQKYTESIFIILMREEGKDILGECIDRAAEFSLCELDSNQCIEFIEAYPFSGNVRKVQEKRQSIRTQLEKNPAITLTFLFQSMPQ